MPPDRVKLKPVAKPRSIFCKPLNLCFPQIYRLHRSHRIPSLHKPLASAAWSLETHGKFSLHCEFSAQSEIVLAKPISHLAPTDRSSLILRHHWSRSRAQAYLQGIEDIAPDRGIGGVFVLDGACFTLSRRATAKAWKGPMIFYLADLFADDDKLSVQSWEMSASCDGIVGSSDIFYDAE